MTETVLRFSHQQHLRIAIEYVDRASMNEPIEVDLQNKTVGQALDSILREGHGYSWQLRNGIIEITNRRASKRAADQFNKVIPLFEISENASVKLVSALLWWNLQMALDPKLKEKGVGGRLSGQVIHGQANYTAQPNGARDSFLQYGVKPKHSGGPDTIQPSASLLRTMWVVVHD